MAVMIELFNTVLKLAFVGACILMTIKLLRSRKSSSVKAEVLNLQARLSKARMALKGKVKKKSNVFRASIKTAIAEGDPVDSSLKQLTENNFEVSQDFQNYFDVSRKIVSIIRAEKDSHTVEPDTNIENDFMCLDFKTELDIIRIIKEMTNIATRINTRIDENNRKNPASHFEKVDSLIFDSLVDVNRVFKDEESSAANNSFKNAS